MSFATRVFGLSAIGIGTLALSSGTLLAQAPPVATNSTGRASAIETPAPPPVPLVRSPVALFRQLLAMNPAEKKSFLSNYSSETQKRILEKLREYEALTPEQGELRLRVTELWYYLPPLMLAPSGERASRLAAIPEELRGLLEIRLQRWDELPPDKQKELLDNQTALHYLFQFTNSTPIQQSQILTSMSPAQRVALAEGINKWQALSEDQRQNLTRRFEEFFGLTSREQDKTLRVLSEPERRQIETTLVVYRRMSGLQRRQCMSSFEKFANLTPTERQEFIQDAARWKAMMPSERQAWRKLVYNLSRQPPLPPGLRPPPLPPPPRPRSPASGSRASVVTNYPGTP